ncbi:hypothetical protein SASPL_108777 [Salvia splendens]|uniref:Trichome birefringence-like N-terminal domain-containing protein n=1 Tax=Salvia splendens TaxID=180675 RepID=A0A8X8YF27_SALSN|nr:hypothetical protein SASPL_108777 [Salvia splendens]
MVLKSCNIYFTNSRKYGFSFTCQQLQWPISKEIAIITITILAFAALFYTQRLGSLSSTAKLRFKPCARSKAVERLVDVNGFNYADDELFDFDPDQCSLNHGKWVFNRSIEPLYSDRTCRFLDRQVSCVKNGRPDSDYRYWEWQPDNCRLPRFDPRMVLRKLKGKRLMFVGDSLQRGQWQSFVCLVDSVIPKGKKSMKRGRLHSVFRAKEYDVTVEFYWAPFVVESNTDVHIKADSKQRIVKVDSVEKHAKHWLGVDILIFNTYMGFVCKRRRRLRRGGDTHFIHARAQNMGKLGGFTTMSPSHHRPADWGNENGTKCFDERLPVLKRSGSDKRMMGVVGSVVARMKVPVTLINITQLSEYRIDAHTSVYTELGGKVLTGDQKADPLHYADCIHWCLPGLPDTWNHILYTNFMLHV